MGIWTGCSASGWPGLSTLTFGLALTWPRPVILVEADPTGASSLLAGFFRGQRDEDGLVELMIAARQGRLSSRLSELLVPVEGTTVRLLVGSRAHEQSVGLAMFWEDLLDELRALTGTGQDILVDAGRLGLDGFATPLVAGSDVTFLVTGSSLRQLAAAASWARTLREQSSTHHHTGAVVVGEGRPYRAREAARALELPLLGTVAWEPRSAEVLSDGEAFPPAPFLARLIHRDADQRRFDASALMRSIGALGESLRSAVATTQADPVERTPAVRRPGLATDSRIREVQQ